VVHHRDANFPPETPHAFVYFLTISNLSQETVKLLGRKWIMRSPDGSTEIVEGDGIVGETPTLPPGEKFSYNSYHLAAGPTTAEGSFHGATLAGERVFTRIPLFAMTPPPDPS
jgi:ApaG protein